MTIPPFDLAREYKQTVLYTLERMKQLADKTMAQLNDTHFYEVPGPESNSIEMLIRHMHGNMLSRWSNFLAWGGDQRARDRDSEFEASRLSRQELLDVWEQGWDTLLTALRQLTSEDLQRTVYFHEEAYTVVQAIEWQISHNSYHVGQIVFLGKHLKNSAWQTLSLPRGQSKSFTP